DSLNISKVKLINDFAAIGYGISVLKKDSDLVTLRKGKPQDGSPIAIIGAGAGTGLKETFLLPKSDGSYQPHSTEGSHADFAPVVTNELNNFEFNGRKLNEYDLLEFIRSKKANLHHVSVERVVSGSGIISIYQFLRDKTNWRESDNIKQIVNRWEESNNETNRQIEDPVPVIINAALDQRNPDPLCEKTMKIFIKFYGGEAGNLAVKVLPYTGLYVAGGLTTHLIDLMKEEKFLNAFLNAFLNKGRMKSLLEKIPVFLVKNSEEVGVIGAATFVSQD
ncbi:MAG: glucokinase, partial [Xenococcus sp. (in: cyanobacteria)]